MGLWRLKFGPDLQVTVFGENGSDRISLEPKNISLQLTKIAQSLRSYGKYKDFHNFSKIGEVKEVVIEYPNNFLKEYEFVDTPGFEENISFDQYVREQYKKSHLIMYVANIARGGDGLTDSQKTEVELINASLHDSVPGKLLFVLNHFDEYLQDVGEDACEEFGEEEEEEEWEKREIFDGRQLLIQEREAKENFWRRVLEVKGFEGKKMEQMSDEFPAVVVTSFVKKEHLYKDYYQSLFRKVTSFVTDYFIKYFYLLPSHLVLDLVMRRINKYYLKVLASREEKERQIKENQELVQKAMELMPGLKKKLERRIRQSFDPSKKVKYEKYVCEGEINTEKMVRNESIKLTEVRALEVLRVRFERLLRHIKRDSFEYIGKEVRKGLNFQGEKERVRVFTRAENFANAGFAYPMAVTIFGGGGVGVIGGGGIGAITGALIFGGVSSIVPVVGTAIGGAYGAVLGGLMGAYAGIFGGIVAGAIVGLVPSSVGAGLSAAVGKMSSPQGKSGLNLKWRKQVFEKFWKHLMGEEDFAEEWTTMVNSSEILVQKWVKEYEHNMNVWMTERIDEITTTQNILRSSVRESDKIMFETVQCEIDFLDLEYQVFHNGQLEIGNRVIGETSTERIVEVAFHDERGATMKQFKNMDFFRDVRCMNMARLMGLRSNFLVPLKCCFRTDGRYRCNIVMDLYQSSLDAVLFDEKKYPLREDEKIKFMWNISVGIRTLHELGILHRDLKPSGIVLGNDNNLYLSNFGICEDRKVSEICGYCTDLLLYSELEDGKEVKYGFERDVFSLGVIMAQILMRRKNVFSSSYFEASGFGDHLGRIERQRLEKVKEVVDLSEFRKAGKRVQKICGLIRSCTFLRGERRPSMKVVVRVLEELRSL